MGSQTFFQGGGVQLLSDRTIRFQKCVSTPCSKLQTETFTECTNMTSVYLSSGLLDNKGADQPTHSHSLISAFVFRSFESIISRLSVAKETGFSLALSKTLKTGLFFVEAQIHYSRPLLLFLFTTAFSFGCFKKPLTCFRLRIVGAAKSIQEQIKR